MKNIIIFFIFSLLFVKGEIFLSEGKEEEKDQLEVEYIENTGPDNGAILSYPKELSSDKKYGIIIWGPGGGTTPDACEGIIRRLDSHGFVVISVRFSPGNGTKTIEALDWLDNINKSSDNPLSGKLDMDMVGCSGHSMGGLEAEQAIIKDSRVKTSILNNSGDWDYVAMSLVPPDRPIAIVYGNNGVERPNAEGDYGNENVKAPACLIMMDGANYEHSSGPFDGMAATVGWFRWHLGGKIYRKADFVGTDGKYINGPIIGHEGYWKGECKNF